MRQTILPLVLCGFAAILQAQSVPTTVNYQGRLTDNTPQQNPVSATVPMKFEIFDSAAGGSLLWSETPAGGIVVNAGIFNVALGSTTPLPASVFTGATSVRYLQITLNPGTGSQQILAPRQLITSSGYAAVAQKASTADTATSATTAITANTANSATTATTATSATTATTATTATNFSGSLAGNVTGTQGATVVSTVGGVTAANVASGANLANAATNANTLNALVKRDASGNFSAGTITAALSGNASTATALAANGSNCAAGSYATGVDAAGNAEGCTAAAAAGNSPFGDGSAGALNIAGATDWSTTPPANANYQFTTCAIGAGVTLTVPSGTLIKCTGSFTMGANSVILVKTWVPGTGTTMLSSSLGASGIIGYPHFSSNPQVSLPGLSVGAASLIVSPPRQGCMSGIGSGTGLGGLPGGTFGIRAKTGITINSGASIQANATNGTSGGTTGGSGGGGGIVILAWGAGSTLSNSGTVQANGGNGSSNTTRDSGGGGGGIIRLIGPGATGGAAYQVAGGSAGNTGTGLTTTGFGPGGACGGYGGYAGLGNGTTYLAAQAGGLGQVITSAVTDPSGLLVP